MVGLSWHPFEYHHFNLLPLQPVLLGQPTDPGDEKWTKVTRRDKLFVRVLYSFATTTTAT